MATAVYIPPGFEYLEGNVKTGFVISNPRCGEFVFVTSDELKANGTLDGKTFDQKFGRRIFGDEKSGRRIFGDEKFGKNSFHETLTDELKAIINSVNKYGGFYISRYKISIKGNRRGYSGKSTSPKTNISWEEAVKVSRNMSIDISKSISSHLVYGAEYDTTFQWLMDKNHKTIDDVVCDSKSLNNEKFKIGNIYDFDGNIKEWTMEEHDNCDHVVRGGSLANNDDCYSLEIQNYQFVRVSNLLIGFRAALTLK